MFTLLTFLLDSLVFDRQLVSKEPILNNLADTLKKKIIPLCFYACDEDSFECASLVWSVIRQSLMLYANSEIFDLINVKKAFIPKFISLLKAHSNCNANTQNTETVYSLLSVLVPRLGQAFEADSQDERLAFYKNILDYLFDGVVKSGSQAKLRANKENIMDIKIVGFFDCFSSLIAQFLSENSNSEQILEFFSKLIKEKVNH